MTRTLSNAIVSLLDDDVVSPFIAVKMPFPSGTTRVWTGHGSITVESETYTGVGSFLSFSEVAESEETKATGITISLSGVPSTTLGTLLTDDFQGMLVEVYLGFLGVSNSVTGTFKLFSGLADNVDIAEAGDSCIVTLKVESRLISLEDKLNRRYTNEDQQIDYSSDTSLRFVDGLQDKEILWGKS